MPSKEYLEAKKEFINCLAMSIVGCGVPIILAFKEWWPIMQEEKRKEQALAGGALPDAGAMPAAQTTR